MSPLASHAIMFIALPILAIGLTWLLVSIDQRIDQLHDRRHTPVCAHGHPFDACPVSWGNHLSDEHGPDEVCECDGFVFECLSVAPMTLDRKLPSDSQNPHLRTNP